jgi:hypothetical protein
MEQPGIFSAKFLVVGWIAAVQIGVDEEAVVGDDLVFSVDDLLSGDRLEQMHDPVPLAIGRILPDEFQFHANRP